MPSLQAVIFVVFYLIQISFQGEVLKVSVYYESLCPYSKDFVTKQLYPGYQALIESIDLELIPFGNAKQEKSDGKWVFTCQHGPKECHGNKIQACILNQNALFSRSLTFINCIMSSNETEKNSAAEKCCTEASISWKKAKLCVHTDKGNQLLANYGNITSNLIPKLPYVPHIRFNDLFNQTLDDNARDGFLQTACELFNEKPKACMT